MFRQWYYRGSLKSCNYSCSYCPFSKRRQSAGELREDEACLVRFVERILDGNSQHNALLVVPYGEALRFSYYWRELARVSRSAAFDRVGGQTNLSFPVEEMVRVYLQNGGRLDKLRLWCTFHPEMTTVEEFAAQCRRLSGQGVRYCAGAVGDPASLERIRSLRALLPGEVYLWVNRLDGKRHYTEQETEAFLEIDPCFWLETRHYPADAARCHKNLFVEADGTVRRCNISRRSIGNLYEEPRENWQDGDCGRKECNCYLAYCNVLGEELAEFGDYPAFRIWKG